MKLRAAMLLLVVATTAGILMSGPTSALVPAAAHTGPAQLVARQPDNSFS